MPTSHPEILSPVLKKVLEVAPKSILDLGIGFGKWGALYREYTDIWAWRFYRKEWTTQIDGIEAHALYRNPNWDQYSTVFEGKIQTVLPGLCQYEMISMLEVLEHFTKEEGLSVLDEIFKHTRKLIVSYTNSHQHNVRDNPLEDHLSQWETSEFMHLGKVTVITPTEDGAVLYIERV